MGDARILDRMALLSDGDIRRYVAKGELRIEPFDEKNLRPNGYDVTIEEVLIRSSSARTSQGVARIPPATRFAVSARESVGLGRHVAGQLWFFFQAEDGIRDLTVTGVQTCALPI